MSLDILDILFKLDYFVCLLIGFPLNIILIILIIFKTPKEMKTHSRILIQNCVLDILILIVQLFLQEYSMTDTEGNTIAIFPNGILIWFMEEKFDPFLCHIVFVVWLYISNVNMHGLCVQFIYRYLVLVRNIKINFRRYLFMASILLFVQLFVILEIIFFIIPYSNGSIKYFDNINKTLPFIQFKMETMNALSLLLPALIEISSYLIIFVCGFKMVKYVNLNTNLDGNLKRLNKLLTKVLIILAVVPFINQAGILFFTIYSKTTNNTTNIIRIIIYISFHLTPVFNPIICILTNTPYRNAIFNRSQVNPQ
uniref:G-protein coupled receptors family 1 profile domain-containing protein n=1 Tax=Meloidogyne enterolobii TaxID=390850 RepID=A0A6V7XIJ6_MELEN|nr:unnamed protein product [Meloidogyne enterolobii]